MVEELLVADRHPRIEDGRTLITGLVRNGFDVFVAFWVQTSVARRWHLYIASQQIVPGKIGNIPLLLYQQIQRIPKANINLEQIKLIPSSDPNALAAVALRDRPTGGTRPFQVYGELGILSVDYAYIYERISTDLTREEVIQRVVSMIERPGTQQPSKLTLRDGSVVQGIPIGLETSLGGVAVSFVDSLTNSRHTILANNVTNIE